MVSKFAFNFNLYRYITAAGPPQHAQAEQHQAAQRRERPGGELYNFANPVVTHKLESAWFQPLRLYSEETGFKVC
jgi:hypothetical protein